MTSPKEPNFQEVAADLLEVARGRAADLEDDLRAQHAKLTRFIRENPLVSVLGALAIGYLVARVTRRDRGTR